LLERHWLSRPPADYERERAVVGDLERLEVPAIEAELPAGSGSAGDLVDLLGRIQAEDPAEPMWSGVTQIREAAKSVQVDFNEEFVDPPLYDVSGVKVACLKFRPDESAEQPA
jgi:hypothetical protein